MTKKERAKERPGKDTVPQERKVRVEGKDAELKGNLKGKGAGGNKPQPTEAEKTTEVERPTKANELEDAEAISWRKAENATTPAVDFPALLLPPKPKMAKKESTGRASQGKQAGLKMEAAPMPNAKGKAEETKASGLKAEASSIAKPKAEEPKTSGGSTAVELKPAKRLKLAERAEPRELLKSGGGLVKVKREVVAKPKAASGVEDEASPSTRAAESLGITPTPKNEKAKKEEVLTDQPDYDPSESDGMETCWVEESEEEEVREEDQTVEEERPRQVLVEDEIEFGGEIWDCREDEPLEDPMANTKRRAFNDTMKAALPDEPIYRKINYKPGRGDDEFFGFETNRDIPGDLDVAYTTCTPPGKISTTRRRIGGRGALWRWVVSWWI